MHVRTCKLFRVRDCAQIIRWRENEKDLLSFPHSNVIDLLKEGKEGSDSNLFYPIFTLYIPYERDHKMVSLCTMAVCSPHADDNGGGVKICCFSRELLFVPGSIIWWL